MGMALAPESLEFSLVPEPVRLRKNLTAKAKDLTSLGTLVMGVLAVASLLCLGMLQEKSFYLAKLNEHLESTVDEALLVEKKKETIRLIQNRLDAKRSALNVLLELHRVTPANAFYERITIESGGRLELRGKARGLPELDRLTRALAESDVIVGDVPSPRKNRTPDNQISFTVTSEVQEEE